jgi:hypothetical protein
LKIKGNLTVGEKLIVGNPTTMPNYWNALVHGNGDWDYFVIQSDSGVAGLSLWRDNAEKAIFGVTKGGGYMLTGDTENEFIIDARAEDMVLATKDVPWARVDKDDGHFTLTKDNNLRIQNSSALQSWSIENNLYGNIFRTDEYDDVIFGDTLGYTDNVIWYANGIRILDMLTDGVKQRTDWYQSANDLKHYFGAGKNASISYDGSNIVINPRESTTTGHLYTKKLDANSVGNFMQNSEGIFGWYTNGGNMYAYSPTTANHYMTIENNGGASEVGIMTTSPSKTLDVNGESILQERVHIGSTLNYIDGDSDGGNLWFRTDNEHIFYSGGFNERFRIHDNGQTEFNSAGVNKVSIFQSTDDIAFMEMKDDDTSMAFGVTGNQVKINNEATLTSNHIIIYDDGNVTLGQNAVVSKDLDVVGNWTGNDYYGEMYIHSDNGNIIQIASSMTYVNVTNGTTCGLLNGFSCSNGILTANVAGVYDVNYQVSFDGIGGDADQFHGTIGIDSVSQDKCHSVRDSSSGSAVGSFGQSCFLQISVGDTLMLMVENEDDADDISVYNTNINLKRIGS